MSVIGGHITTRGANGLKIRVRCGRKGVKLLSFSRACCPPQKTNGNDGDDKVLWLMVIMTSLEK